MHIFSFVCLFIALGFFFICLIFFVCCVSVYLFGSLHQSLSIHIISKEKESVFHGSTCIFVIVFDIPDVIYMCYFISLIVVYVLSLIVLFWIFFL